VHHVLDIEEGRFVSISFYYLLCLSLLTLYPSFPIPKTLKTLLAFVMHHSFLCSISIFLLLLIPATTKMVPWWDADVVNVKNPDQVPDPLPNNPDDEADDLERKALANNQGANINTNISNSENPSPNNLPEDEQKVDGGKSSVSLEPENSVCTKRLSSRAAQRDRRTNPKFQWM